MILVIDNYDSFTYNLVQLLAALGAEVEVRRNDARHRRGGARAGARRASSSRPGPGTPDDAGISRDVIRAAAEAGVPLLGVCLGHQCIAEVYGGSVCRAPRPVHGKTDEIDHDGTGLFAGHAEPVHRDALPLAVRGRRLACPTRSRSRRRTPDGVVMGAAPPRAARLRRAVPPRERADARGREAARELPRRRPARCRSRASASGAPAAVAASGGSARASRRRPPRSRASAARSARVSSGGVAHRGRGAPRHEPGHGRRGDAVADQRARHGDAHEGRDRRRDRRVRARDARARHAGAPDASPATSTRAARAATACTRSTSRRRRRSSSRAPACRSPSTATAPCRPRRGQRRRARGARRRHRRSTPADMARCIDEAGVGFLFAQALHASMRHAGGTAPRDRHPHRLQHPRAAHQPRRREAPAPRRVRRRASRRSWPRSPGASAPSACSSSTAIPAWTRSRRPARPPSPSSTPPTARVRTYEITPGAGRHRARHARRHRRRRRRARTPRSCARSSRASTGPRRDVVLMNAAAALLAAGQGRRPRRGRGAGARVDRLRPRARARSTRSSRVARGWRAASRAQREARSDERRRELPRRHDRAPPRRASRAEYGALSRGRPRAARLRARGRPRDFAAALDGPPRRRRHRRGQEGVAERGPDRAGLRGVQAGAALPGRRARRRSACSPSPRRSAARFADLSDVADAVDIPVLCKDFVVDPVQLFVARGHGADAVLLMVSVLGDLIAEYVDLARDARPDAARRGRRRATSSPSRWGSAAPRDRGEQPRPAHARGRPGRRARGHRARRRASDAIVVAASGDRDARRRRSVPPRPGADAVLVGETLMRARVPGGRAGGADGRAASASARYDRDTRPRTSSEARGEPRTAKEDRDMPDRTRFGLDETQTCPTAWYNMHARPKTPPAPTRTCTRTATSSGRTRSATSGAALPDGAASSRRCRRTATSTSPARSSTSTRRTAPRRCIRARQLEKDLGLPDGREDLLQVRGRQPGRLAQAQHRHPAGVLQQAGGHHEDLDRDRRGPVGQRALDRRRALRHRRRGLHGQGQLRPEAVPPHPHGDVRRHGARLADAT